MGHRGHWFPIVFFSGVAALAIACKGSGAAQTASSSGGGEIRVNLEEIFPPGPGRDLVLENCQNCHTFVPIVVLQMDKDAWQRNSLDHRERVTTLTDEQFKTLYEYLTTNFGPHRPVPKLPKELLKTWTGY
jgi:mono/diheme cytochrome c family protein